ncbi:MAG TPA: glycosyltransferase family 2 protein [Chthoniobacterales bacterium]
MPELSVVIPTFNRAKLLARALASLPSTAAGDLEIIVVDDGSSDGTEEVVGGWKRPVRFLRQDHAGPGRARNLGWDQATAPYVAFLDSDDVWLPWTLAVYRALLCTDPPPSMVIGAPFWFEDEAELARAARGPLATRTFPDYLASAGWPIWLGASSLLVRRDIGPRFETERMNAEDLDLAIHLGGEPGFVWVQAPATFGYRRHPSTLVSNLQGTLTGVGHLISEETEGRYPGGQARRRARWQLITRAVRPPALAALRAGRWAEGFRLYALTWRWHVALGRWRFLLAFPVLAAWARWKRPKAGQPLAADPAART